MRDLAAGRSRAVAMVAWAGLYLASDLGLRGSALPVSHVIPWYPGAGLALVALVTWGMPAVLTLFALRLLLAIAGPDRSQPLWLACIDAAGIAVAYAVGALVVRRFVAWRAGVWRARDALWLASAIAVAAILAAGVSAASEALQSSTSLGQLARDAASFAAADAAGAMVVAPLALFVLLPAWRARLAARGRSARTSDDRVVSSMRDAPVMLAGLGPTGDGTPSHTRRHVRLERWAQAIVVALTIAGGVIAHMHGRTTLGYACFLPLAWVALRDGVRGAAIVIAAYGVACGVTGLWLGLSAEAKLESQLILLNLSLAGLLLGATRSAAVESDARYWHLLAAANEGIWRIGRDGRTTYVNARAAEMLGSTPASLVGRAMDEFLTPAHRVVADGVLDTHPWEGTLARPSGTSLPVLVRMIPVRSATTGEPIGAVAMLTDVSDWHDAERRRVAAERARERAQQLLEAVFRASRDAMLVFRDDGTVVEANDTWSRDFATPGESMFGVRLDSLRLWVDPRDITRLLRVLRDAAARGGIVRDFPVAIHRAAHGGATSEPGRGLVTVAPAIVEGATYHLMSCHDVTDERRALEARERVRRFEELGRLAGGIAHDFNNVLTIVRSYAQVIRDAASRGERVDPEDAAEIEHAAARGTGLTQHLLAFSRNRPIEPRILDLNDLVRAATGLLRPLLGGVVTVEYRLGNDALPISTDAVQLDQVLLNLVVNAVDAMPEGGALLIATSRVLLPNGEEASAADVRPGEFAALAVTDTGHGMDDATRTRIFEPFFTTKDPDKGTGLGLAVVAGIVRRAGGTVRVRTAVGRGTTITVLWPLVDAQAASPAASRAVESGAA